MKHRRQLYDYAKQYNTKQSWSSYCKARNKVNIMVRSAHEWYRTRILDTTFSGQKYQFWKYIKAMKKDTSSTPSLTVDDRTVISAKEKACVLNDQFQSVLTVEDLTTIPEIGTGNFHTMQPIQFSETWIQMLLQNLKANKSPGLDRTHPFVLKHCSYELAPILNVIFTKLLNTGSIPSDWLLANITPVYKKGNKDLPVNYCPIYF